MSPMHQLIQRLTQRTVLPKIASKLSQCHAQLSTEPNPLAADAHAPAAFERKRVPHMGETERRVGRRLKANIARNTLTRIELGSYISISNCRYHMRSNPETKFEFPCCSCCDQEVGTAQSADQKRSNLCCLLVTV